MKRVIAILALVGAAPLSARDLAVPADKGWQHAETGLILPAHLAGLSRTALADATETEHDVSAQFDALDKSLFATVYLYHPAIPDIAMWFDRSRTALEARDTFRDAAPATIDPVAFAAGGTSVPSALRQTYALAGGPYRSTALALVPVGEWIVAVRLTARALTADRLDARLQQVIAEVRWPTPGATEPTTAATPIGACATPLAVTKARLAKPNGADMLMSLLGGVAARRAAAKATPAPRSTWCREGEGGGEYGVYRSSGAPTGYVLALADAGRSVSVYPSLMGQVDKSGTYSVSLTDVDGTVSTYSSFSSLPMPKQVWNLVKGGRPTGTAAGGRMTIDAKAL